MRTRMSRAAEPRKITLEFSDFDKLVAEILHLRALTKPGEGCETTEADREFIRLWSVNERNGQTWVRNSVGEILRDLTREAARANAAISERDENGRAAKRRQDFIDRLRDDKQPMADNSGEITAAEDVLTWLLIEKLTCSDDRSYTPHEAQKIVATALDERDTLKARVAELEAGLRALRGLVREGGVPRYTVTPGAALNSVIEEVVDPLLTKPTAGDQTDG